MKTKKIIELTKNDNLERLVELAKVTNLVGGPENVEQLNPHHVYNFCKALCIAKINRINRGGIFDAITNSNINSIVNLEDVVNSAVVAFYAHANEIFGISGNLKKSVLVERLEKSIADLKQFGERNNDGSFCLETIEQIQNLEFQIDQLNKFQIFPGNKLSFILTKDALYSIFRCVDEQLRFFKRSYKNYNETFFKSYCDADEVGGNLDCFSQLQFNSNFSKIDIVAELEQIKNDNDVDARILDCLICKKITTMTEIAKCLNLSISTISRHLNKIYKILEF